MFNCIKYDMFGSDVIFHHLGIVVPRINDLLADNIIYEDLIQKVFVTFIEVGGQKIELIQPIDNTSPVANSLKKGIPLAHICYEVNDLKITLNSARNKGFNQLGKTNPAIAFEGRSIAWIYHRRFGLVELLEMKR